ncbi:MAG: sugar phosphate isomerase/epimerase family protein [Candidatus Bathyarchaeia archaeon]
MKLAICNRIWVNYSFDEAIRRIAWLGYGAVEIWGCRPHAYTRDMDKETMKDRKKSIAQAGLEVPCLTPDQMYPVPYVNPASMYEKQRTESIEFLKASIDCAAQFGAPMMSMGPGKRYYDQSLQNAWELLVEAFGECADHAKSLGLKICAEPLPPIESNLVNTLQDFLELSHDVNATNLGCLLDMGHMNVLHEDGVDYVRTLGEKLYHVHVNDNNGVVDQGLIPGQGVLDYQPFIRALREIGYKGYLSLELSFNYQQDPDSAAHKAKLFMDNVLKTS